MRPPVAAGVTQLLGFTRDGYVVTQRDNPNDTLDFWDLTRGVAGGSAKLPHLVRSDRFISDDGRLEVGGPREPALPLATDAAQWVDRLCAVADRDFTDAELHVLPPGTPTDRPCPPR